LPSTASARRASAASSTSSRTHDSAALLGCHGELSDEPARRLRPLRRGAHGGPFLVSRRSTRAPARCCRRAGRHVLHQPTSRAHLGRRVGRPPRAAARSSTRADEPHADAERYAACTSSWATPHDDYATFLRVGATSILLRMLEDPSVVLRDMSSRTRSAAIREISHDITCRRRVRLANGREGEPPSDIQWEYSTGPRATRSRRACRPREQALACGSTVSPASRRSAVAHRECDWVIKHHLLEAYATRTTSALHHPKMP